jgi:transcription antitermination protein NusB
MGGPRRKRRGPFVLRPAFGGLPDCPHRRGAYTLRSRTAEEVEQRVTINRHQVREMAMQVLFLWDSHGNKDELAARQYVMEAAPREPEGQQSAMETAAAAWELRGAADRWVEKVAPQWPVHRQPPVDRSILRLGVWELVNTKTPPRVVIDECIKLARTFSTENSAGFINGVLDAILREHREITSGLVDPAKTPAPAATDGPDAPVATVDDPIAPPSNT